LRVARLAHFAIATGNFSNLGAWITLVASTSAELGQFHLEVHMILKTTASLSVLTLLLGATVAMAQTSPPAQRPAPSATTEVPNGAGAQSASDCPNA